MIGTVLIATNAVSFSLGALVMYLVTTTTRARNATPPRKGNKMPWRHRLPPVPSIIIVSSTVVLGIGAQAWLSQHHDQEVRHHDQVVRHHEQVRQCKLDTSVHALYQLLNDRADANRRLAVAREAKDDANDQVVLVVAQGRKHPPTTPQELRAAQVQFDKALDEFTRAKNRLTRVQTETAPILKNQKPFHLPVDTARKCEENPNGGR